MFVEVTLSLLQGFVTTLRIFALTLLMALPLGLIVSFGSMSKYKAIKWPVKTFIWIIRGTPLMLQLVVIFYGPGLAGSWASKPGCGAELLASLASWESFTWLSDSIAFVVSHLIGWLATWHTFDRFVAVIVAFVINYACYFSEIFRGGIESIPRGQYEAGQVLGMTKPQVFFKVVLFQVIKRVVPPMSNEIITLVKDTSLARIIMVYEIIWNAQKFIKSAGLLWPLFYTGAFYLIFCGILTLMFGYIEKKMDYYKG